MLTSLMRLRASATVFIEPLRYRMEKSKSCIRLAQRPYDQQYLVGHKNTLVIDGKL